MTAAFLTCMLTGAAVGQVPDGFEPQVATIMIDGHPQPYTGHRRGKGHFPGGNWILGPGPGDGWGFPNGAPDGYGWYAPGANLPLGADRTPEYYFPRYFAEPAQAVFFPTYYNKYITRGQRYLPWAGCGGMHPVGHPAMSPASMPVTPYEDAGRRGPVVEVPDFGGEIEARPVDPGESDLAP